MIINQRKSSLLTAQNSVALCRCYRALFYDTMILSKNISKLFHTLAHREAENKNSRGLDTHHPLSVRYVRFSDLISTSNVLKLLQKNLDLTFCKFEDCTHSIVPVHIS